MKYARVTIPATSANLGPGFDCLGLALGLYNKVTLTRGSVPGELTLSACGIDADRVPNDAGNLVVQAAQIVFKRLGTPPPGLHIHQDNGIPVGSGLGSSSTAVLAGMFLANAVCGSPLTRFELLEMATLMEGHPDNVAPAVYGGLVLGVQSKAGLHVERIPLPPQKVTVVLPDFNLLTETARAALPQEVPLADAIFNSSRVGLLIRALTVADYSALSVAMADRLHQPYRVPLIPGMADAFVAAMKAGAAGVALSGAGPSIIAFAPALHEQIGQAIALAFDRAGLRSQTWVLDVDVRGLQIEVEAA